MQSEADWLSTIDDEEIVESYRYFMRPDPGMVKELGPIETVDDPVTGRQMRWRFAKVGMLRGVSAENMKDVKVWLDPMPHIRQEKAKDLQGWYQGKQFEKGSRPRPCETDAILSQPYGGHCSVSCPFCYLIAGTRGYRASRLITVPVGYGEHVRKQLASMRTATAGYFSSFNDPFLEVEKYYHNTQNGVQAFLDAGLPVFFLSRLAYPDWAIDALRKNPLSYAQKSINTPDPEDWAKLSPGALPLLDHMEEIRKLKQAGIYVSIQCNPIIAGIVTHEDVEQLFEMLAEAGADHVIIKFVEANHPWAPAMVERITKKFGDNRAAAFRDLFVENSCGGQKTIEEGYRREGATRYRAKATKLGMTFSLCYEYTRRPDGIWKSMGPEFLTADQCHGHRVPIHTKGRDSMFHPLEVCPPSGCLRCADTNKGEPRCGSELLGQAKALRLSDLRQDPSISQTLRRSARRSLAQAT
jgi:DNA repair photolyase